jgi:integrase
MASGRCVKSQSPQLIDCTIGFVRGLFDFAQRREFVRINPTKGIKRLRGGGHYARWTDDDIARFRRANDYTHPMMSLALDFGLYAALRSSDACAATWSNYDGQHLYIRQKMTGVEISILVHPDLRIALEKMHRLAPSILTNVFGKPFKVSVFTPSFRRACERARLPRRLCFHGLRHTAACRLAEFGAGGPEIQAVTGHKSLLTVCRYISQASQRIRADNAISRIPSRYVVEGSPAEGATSG